MSDSTPQALIPDVKTRVRLVYTHPDPKVEGWPYQGYDYEGRKTELTARLRQSCPKVEFAPVMARSEQDARKLLEADSEVDGYLVYILGIPSNAARTIAMSNRPAILVDDLYGGTGQFLGVYGETYRSGMRVAGVTSSRFDDVAKAVTALEVMKRMSASTILDVTERQIGDNPRIFQESMGVKIQTVSAQELNSAYDSADRSESRKWAKEWMSGAAKIVEPSTAEIEKGGAMYVGMRNLLASNKAQGIAVDCLSLFYGKKMFAYPCMGFFQLNNDGLVGACEADIQSAATMLLMTYLTGRPGYISDPVIDTARNQVIYAHCVAPNKVYGPAGKENAYHIRSHSEDRKGAAVRSLMPLGEMTTTLRFIPPQKTVVFHQARSVANIDEDKACRTKLAAEVKDARKLARDWAHGWHRVTVYGDYRAEVETITSLMGFKLADEG
jgi:L-fucose isomerase-like protein